MQPLEIKMQNSRKTTTAYIPLLSTSHPGKYKIGK